MKRRKVHEARPCRTCGVLVWHHGPPLCVKHLPDELRCRAVNIDGTRCCNPVQPPILACKTHRGFDLGARNAGTGWTYLFDTRYSSAQRGIFKLGCSNNVPQRCEDLRHGNPFGYMVCAARIGRKGRRHERQLHLHFRRQLVGRELFALTSQDVRFVWSYLQDRAQDWIAQPAPVLCVDGQVFLLPNCSEGRPEAGA